LTITQFFKSVIIGIILGVLLVACASNNIRITRHHKKIPKEIEKSRKMLYDITEGSLGDRKISIGFMRFSEYKKYGSSTVIGTCNLVLSEASSEIDIRKDYWYSFSLKEQILLLGHEYFHCQCPFFGHINGVLEDRCPADFMNSSIPDSICINRHWDIYEKQLKEGCNGVRRHKSRDTRAQAADVQIR